jgi:hypothetical protein
VVRGGGRREGKFWKRAQLSRKSLTKTKYRENPKERACVLGSCAFQVFFFHTFHWLCTAL